MALSEEQKRRYLARKQNERLQEALSAAPASHESTPATSLENNAGGPALEMPTNTVEAVNSSEMENGERECPFCAEVIKKKASKCRYCGSIVLPFTQGKSCLFNSNKEEEIGVGDSFTNDTCARRVINTGRIIETVLQVFAIILCLFSLVEIGVGIVLVGNQNTGLGAMLLGSGGVSFFVGILGYYFGALISDVSVLFARASISIIRPEFDK